MTEPLPEFEHPIAIGTIAAFMRSARVADQLSSVLLIGTFLLLLDPPSWWSMIAACLALGAAVAEKYYGWRSALDAELFTLLAQQPQHTEKFDAAMAAMLGKPATQASRTMHSRWLGARRLLLGQAVALAAQLLAIAAAVLT